MDWTEEEIEAARKMAHCDEYCNLDNCVDLLPWLPIIRARRLVAEVREALARDQETSGYCLQLALAERLLGGE